MKNVNEMSLDELRDELAVAGGWHRTGGALWWHDDGRQTTDPIPATLDAIAGCWKDGWRWCKNTTSYCADDINYDLPRISVPDTGDEKLDRARLACACHRSARSTSAPSTQGETKP